MVRRELAPGVIQFQAAAWEANSLLVATDGDAVLVDPCFRPDELDQLQAALRDNGGKRAVVALTHGDLDHVCGSGSFPHARVIAHAETADRVANEAPAALADAERDWNVSWPRPLRVDEAIAPGRLDCGAVALEAIEARNHGADGLAYAFSDHGVLAAGDFLSPVAIPALLGSLDAMRASLHTLLERIGSADWTWIVPGHGPALGRDEALAIGTADLAYLDALVAAGAAGSDLSRIELAMRVYAVEPPRPSSAEFELYGERITTSWKVVEGLRGTA